MLKAEGLKCLSCGDSNDPKKSSPAPEKEEAGEAGSGTLIWSLLAFLLLGLIILVG